MLLMQVMIFVKSTARANMLGSLLKDARFPCEVLHGSMKMPERQAIMKKFKESPNEARILVSTDLTSRGVDVERVNVVVNYDMPVHMRTYVHRAGRTARAGSAGRVVTLLRTEHRSAFQRMLREAGAHEPGEWVVGPEEWEAASGEAAEALAALRAQLVAEQS